MIPALDASIIREAWQRDGQERSGRDWQEITMGKHFYCPLVLLTQFGRDIALSVDIKTGSLSN
jgi:hypothetical protein